jgi:hypothetical protein
MSLSTNGFFVNSAASGNIEGGVSRQPVVDLSISAAAESTAGVIFNN